MPLLSDGIIASAVVLNSFNSYLDVLGEAATDLEHPAEFVKSEIRISTNYLLCIA